MEQLTCCNDSAWVLERDLGHAAGFEFVLGRCGSCGAAWMNVFCVATSASGYERVGADELASIRSTPDGPALKAIMRRWADETI